MATNRLRIGLIGYRFMGKMHSHAYRVITQMMTPRLPPELVVLCGREIAPCNEARAQWGWREASNDWKSVVRRSDIDAVDIATPSNVHAEIAIEALRQGKHVFCEKPLANSMDEAQEMMDLAQQSGKVHMVGFNYRWIPAVKVAHDLIRTGRLGRIYHVHAQYLQDWAMDPNVPLSWRFQKSFAGSGALGDLLSHAIDLIRFLVGEFQQVSALQTTFVHERPLVKAAAGSGIGSALASDARGTVSVDDATVAIGQLDTGALVSLEATRFASGRKNVLRIEVSGSNGSVIWDLERLNELLVNMTESTPPHLEGFRRVHVTHPDHPYMRYWWPEGHSIGYDIGFVHELYEWIAAIAEERIPSPNFEDGVRCQQVMTAMEQAAASSAVKNL